MNGEKKRCTAIVLAAGSGSRMKSAMAKQYMLLGDKPLIWYALHAVEQSEIIDDCILVAAPEDLEYVCEHIVAKYDFCKVNAIAAGGTERCWSVAGALNAIVAGSLRIANTDGYVFIHDGARPFLTEQIIKNTYEAVKQYHACVAAVLSKDTVKIADEQGFTKETPDRKRVWSIQTPQVFDTELIVKAYKMLEENKERLKKDGIEVTDDAGVVELFTGTKVKLVEGSYKNIKITTPEDIKTAEAFLQQESLL